jgi:hypothetical protein
MLSVALSTAALSAGDTEMGAALPLRWDTTLTSLLSREGSVEAGLGWPVQAYAFLNFPTLGLSLGQES